MNILSKILFKIGVLKLTPQRVIKWTNSKEISKLEYALVNGLYNVRQLAAKGLGQIKSKSSLPLLIEKIDDNIKSVSFEVMTAIDHLELIDLSSEIKQKIKDKKEYWKIKELQDIENAKKIKNIKSTVTKKWNRTSKQALENVKQQLKTPINGGKWF